MSMLLVFIVKQFANALVSASTAFIPAFTICLSISLASTIISALQFWT